MTQYVIRRILLAIPTLLLMLTVIFVLVRLVPGDAAITILGDQASEESLSRLRAQLGLDQPIHVQYFSFLAQIASGNFGQSLATGRSVLQEVAAVLPYTLELTAAALLIGALIGVPLGTVAALNRNRWPDYFSRVLSLIGL
ncbi:MAG TPA: ABC transporter permease, partial [Paracoccus sp. (in: a-proteobacteria)]|nr:ABC transporter permease [Paracoccus sp. (in: a-proteobacteria)]